MPKAWHWRPEIDKESKTGWIEVLAVAGFPSIRIYYLVAGNNLRVIRILHGKRDINPMLENESEGP